MKNCDHIRQFNRILDCAWVLALQSLIYQLCRPEPRPVFARANDPSRLRQPILSGHQSTLLCHLGNIAHRTGRVIHTDASSGRLLDTDLPQGLWRREYDPAWEKLVSEI
jgi:hypothetical protein